MDAKQYIAEFFKRDAPLNHEGLAELLAAFELKRLPKHSLVLQAGGYEKTLRFIVGGQLREFYKTEQKEININFYTRPQFVTDFSAFMQGGKTNKYQETLSAVDMLELGRENFLHLLSKYNCGQSFVDASFQRVLEDREQFAYNRMTKDAATLYQELQLSKPHWLRHIPQYHIASYLGVTPETLSRIRKRAS